MFEKIRIRISDFFNRLPAIVLVPVVLLIAFTIAGFFIWAGIELSPVTQKTAEDLLAPKATVQDSQNAGDRSSKTGNSNASQDSDSSGSQTSSGRGTGAGEDYAGSENSDGSSGGSGGSSGGTSGNKSGGSDQSSSSGTGSGSTSGSSSSNSDSGAGVADSNSNSTNQASGSGDQAGNNSNANQNSSDGGSGDNPDGGGTQPEEECYHPPGRVDRWWYNASPKQKECYISQHGMPDLGQQVPYFCDYNNSEDCYYR